MTLEATRIAKAQTWLLKISVWPCFGSLARNPRDHSLLLGHFQDFKIVHTLGEVNNTVADHWKNLGESHSVMHHSVYLISGCIECLQSVGCPGRLHAVLIINN